MYKNGLSVLKEWLGEGAITVDRESAQKRANICISCPKNVKDWVITDAMASAIKSQLEIKKHLEMKVDGEKSLHTCSGCGCITRLKIWLPLRNILPDESERANFDKSCWLFSESDNQPKP
jgi:hypothetical protein